MAFLNLVLTTAQLCNLCSTATRGVIYELGDRRCYPRLCSSLVVIRTELGPVRLE